MTNERIGAYLLEYARQLARDGDNLYRVRAYRHAGFEVGRIARPLREVFAESGKKGLEGLPGIGRSIAVTIAGLLTSGEFQTRKVA
jgi:DNA polymerase (family 10)